jgi:hypothetical protein
MARTRKNPHAVALGRLGGKKGGPARAAALTPEQRRESARKFLGVAWMSLNCAQPLGNHKYS